jgi:predicted lactoylglutathione lyase
MTRQIFVNLPVANVARAQAFYLSLGFRLEPRFSNASAACIVISDSIQVMLLDRPFFQTFTHKPICEAQEATEAILCLSCESRAEVDDLAARAVAAGGSAPRESLDHGFMYGHGFEDPDGHIWELVYMVPGAEIQSVSEEVS